MNKNKISEADIELLNTKIGLYSLFKHKKVNVKQAIKEARYFTELRSNQEELIKLQNWVIKNDKKVVVLFEGRDVAGKGGAIKSISEYINPRHYSIVALNIPTEDEKKQWFFQRYIQQLPHPGEMVFFDRSWYNRAMVEPVNKFCTEKEYKIFMSHVNDFERMLVESDIYLIKFYFSITKKEQARRFDEIKSNPLKRWKMTPVDKKAQALWGEYTKYKKKMFEKTDTSLAPWTIIDANEKYKTRLTSIKHILKTIPYK